MSNDNKYNVRSVADFLDSWEDFQAEHPDVTADEIGFAPSEEETDDEYDIVFFKLEADEDDADEDDLDDEDE